MPPYIITLGSTVTISGQAVFGNNTESGHDQSGINKGRIIIAAGGSFTLQNYTQFLSLLSDILGYLINVDT
jgi:hypothetical protein